MSLYGTTLSARYEDDQQASAVMSGGPASQLCDFPDSDDAPPRPATRAFGFVVSDSVMRRVEIDPDAVEPLLYEGDQG